ncbi:cupin domain-containing protein [Variovorax sp. E3]|uniref:cupin domain-containing protein n=1 Tax=Variovorax sp. E3 TaxID=1914993 RepID=UPI0018DE237E|nr:cupin domain-containing protein [Variovorax sp. E3]
MTSLRLIPGHTITSEVRGGAAGGVAEISWVVMDSEGAALPCGFGRWHEAACESKLLDYDEIILVLEGVFGVETASGERVEGRPGDVIEIRKGTTVRYFGREARLFFVTN